MLQITKCARRMSRDQQRGFTMLELMIVVVILGILAAAVVPQVVGKDEKARVQRAKSDIASLMTAIEDYKLDNYRYPTTDQGLQALVQKPSDAKNWNPKGYLRSKKQPVDPWNQPYDYISDGRSFELCSLGADGQEGGQSYDADFCSTDI